MSRSKSMRIGSWRPSAQISGRAPVTGSAERVVGRNRVRGRWPGRETSMRRILPRSRLSELRVAAAARRAAGCRRRRRRACRRPGRSGARRRAPSSLPSGRAAAAARTRGSATSPAGSGGHEAREHRVEAVLVERVEVPGLGVVGGEGDGPEALLPHRADPAADVEEGPGGRGGQRVDDPDVPLRPTTKSRGSPGAPSRRPAARGPPPPAPSRPVRLRALEREPAQREGRGAGEARPGAARAAVSLGHGEPFPGLAGPLDPRRLRWVTIDTLRRPACDSNHGNWGLRGAGPSGQTGCSPRESVGRQGDFSHCCERTGVPWTPARR